ncbi:probable endopolygalacturonase I [Dendroctonus ponderosae]|uniref:probable endopolygalacturonase I n=1 Tax=Dendroctonus ponderosae TaxID=77166 RepID=UPI0020361398|nr:probable endopolygalacturonase I [Dendroctonus ponderosae]
MKLLVLILTLIEFGQTIETRDSTCVVSQLQDLARITKSCHNITIRDLFVPAGETLVLDLLVGATVTFLGNVDFALLNWAGPLMRLYGNAITINGAPGHSLNGQGELYWDTLGSWGTKKPKFLIAEVSNGSIIKGLRFKNAPIHGIYINNSHDALFTDILIDNSEGDENVALYGHAGHNTDGFGVARSSNITIAHATVFNQDDCVVLNSGSNIYVHHLTCYGSHGISISVGFSNDSIEQNTLSDVLIEDALIFEAMSGIHIKTHIDAGVGLIRNITYRNIGIIGSYSYGICIEQNYTNRAVPNTGAPPLSNIPIVELNFFNVFGAVKAAALPYYVICAKGACSDWNWNFVHIFGQRVSVCVNYHPNDVSCMDYTV